MTFQLTRSVGSVTAKFGGKIPANLISTHTLRGERDQNRHTGDYYYVGFQLTRSVGSVTRSAVG